MHARADRSVVKGNQNSTKNEEMKKMKKLYCKTKLLTIALVLALTFAALTASISYVVAQETATRCFLSVQPNPVGRGQIVTVSVMVQPVPPSMSDVYHDVKLDITKPDGTIETTVKDSWSTGGYYIQYIPDMAGIYYLQMSYPGETFAQNRIRSASESPVTELVVQEDPIPSWPETPPTGDFWDRPVSADLREWAHISGNWLQSGYNTTYQMGRSPSAYNPYSTAPRSSHVVWTEELGLGGLAGGEFGSASYYGGLVYENYLKPPIVMNGLIYYNLYFDSSPFSAFVCVDLRTGEELWRVEGANVDVGQLWDYRSPNQYGVIPFLWETGSTYNMYDAFTGRFICNFTGASTGRIVFDDDGTMLVYMLNARSGQVSMWNSTKAFEENGLISGFGGVGMFRFRTGTYDWQRGIEWEVTTDIASMTVGGRTYYPNAFSVSGDVILASAGLGSSQTTLHAGYSATNGSLLWFYARDPPDMPLIRTAVGDGVFALHNTVSTRFHGYDVATGEPLWESDELVYPWGTYIGLSMLIADEKLLAGSYDGYMHAFDIDTGKELWKYSSGDANIETATGTWPFFYSFMAADGVVFAPTGEHSASQPLYRGAKLHAIDMETGEGVWNLTGWYVNAALVDGYLLTHNAYTNQMYCIGKGQSATTVTAPQTEIELGESVIIRGTVTDQSPALKDTPAISDECMSAWMEYKLLQHPIPEDATGVTVKLTAVFPNGETQEIGTATSDMYGNFGKSWTPEVEGDYRVIATFEGTASYGSSSDSTYLTVGPAAEEAPSAEEIAQTTLTQMPAYPEIPAYLPIDLIILIIAAVVLVIGLLAYVALRKQK
jgi:outer membrane protein assembly factor BamB